MFEQSKRVIEVTKRRLFSGKTSSAPFSSLFCSSTGRVGSKLIADLFESCPGCASYHEPSPTLFSVSKHCYTYSLRSDRLLCTEFLKAAREELIGAANKDGHIYVETSPQGSLAGSVLKSWLPTAKFLVMVRHPAEVIRSGMRRGWYAGHSFDKYRIVPGGESGLDWDTMDAFEKNCWLWGETNRHLCAFADTLPAGDSAFLKSESLFDCDLGEIKKTLVALGIQCPPDAIISRKLARVRNQQKSGDFPEYSDWTEQQKRVLKAHCGQMMERFEYA